MYVNARTQFIAEFNLYLYLAAEVHDCACLGFTYYEICSSPQTRHSSNKCHMFVLSLTNKKAREVKRELVRQKRSP